MRHWISMREYEPQELAGLVKLAKELKAGRAREVAAAIKGRILTLVFFNPSLRTRASFESAMLRFGGHAYSLSVGGDAWKLEHRDGVVMDGEAAEHLKEAAPVLSRYCDAIGVRTFAGLKDPADDAVDHVMRSFGKYATVPVLNLESAIEHPCQGLADWMTADEQLGGTLGRRFVVSWAPQVKGLPMAVPHSAVLAAAAAGMNVTVAHPPGYDLNAGILECARRWCSAAGSMLTITNDQRAACAGADVLYVKSWGSTAFYGNPDEQKDSFREYADWMVDLPLLGPKTLLMHCLPVRRNLVIADAALDDPRCIVVDQAENRMWTQAAVLCRIFGGAM